MSKILLSWYAFKNDFDEKKRNEVLTDGPTMSFHRDFYDAQGYDRHIILTSQPKVDEDMLLLHLRSAIQKTFPMHRVDTKALNVGDVIDLMEIKSKVEPVLESFSDHEIDIFISPGTPAMQTAWILLHMNKGLRTRLLQVREKRFTKRKEKNELVEVQIDRDATVSSVVIREQRFDTPKSTDDYYLSSSLKTLYERAMRVSQADQAAVLITGASGSGKEHLAKYLHNNSPRKEKPFLPVNCSAFTDDLLRSELFGHMKGSFTGATNEKKGLIEEAKGGTIFLDEIGDVSPFIQQSLLRVLQQKEILPVGSTKSISVDVRFIAATNADLIEKCTSGAFRWDLFYRLAVVELHVPTLLERGKDEIQEYIQFFLKSKAKKYRQPQLKLSTEVKSLLRAYSFPGNLRELENLIESFYVICDSGEVQLSHVPSRITHPPANVTSLKLEDVEKAHVQKVLLMNKGNLKRTANDLGVVVNTLKKKIKDYQIEA